MTTAIPFFDDETASRKQKMSFDQPADSESTALSHTKSSGCGCVVASVVSLLIITLAVLFFQFEFPLEGVAIAFFVFVFIGIIGGSLMRLGLGFNFSSPPKPQEWRTAAALAEQKTGDTKEDWQERDWQPEENSSGMIELKSNSSPLGGLIFMTIFCLFWNGITSIFLMDVVNQWGKGDQPWFLTLFLMPFLLVGVSSLGGVIYMTLAMFNPRPRVWISDTTVVLGESFQLTWEFTGSVSSIQKLTIQLVGTEWAQYRQGTNTYTDTEEFYCEDLINIDHSPDMVEGKVEITIPQKTMHSFNASNNKIKWSLKFNGDIPRWPDVSQNYEFTVLPIPLK